MRISLNGRDTEAKDGSSVASLLEDLKLGLSKSAVAVNSRVIPRSKLGETFLADGDTVEIIEAVGGG